MLEAAKDFIPGTVTNGLGFEPIRPSSSLPETGDNRRRYDSRLSLYVHLAGMDLQTSSDPAQKSSLVNFMQDTKSWLEALLKVGMGDFDVKSSEELRHRVAVFKENGPLEKTIVQQVTSPAISTPGHFHLRQDLALLTAGILVTLLTTTHTEVLAQSYDRTVAGLQDKCAILLPKIKSEHPDEYNQYLASSASSNPDSDFVQRCTQIAERAYLARDDLLQEVTDREKMLRVGFTMTMFGGITSALIGGYMSSKRLIDRLSRNKGEIPLANLS